MSWFYLDPSAWVKRYVAEPGSEVMDALWEALTRGQGRAFCGWLGFGELVWVLQRWRNRRGLDEEAFRTVYWQFRQDCQQVVWCSLSWQQVQASVSWIVRYNLNATDALHLQLALEQASLEGEEIWLVSSDRRLIRAAQAESLRSLDPEYCVMDTVKEILG